MKINKRNITGIILLVFIFFVVLFKLFYQKPIDFKYCYFIDIDGKIDKQVIVGGENEINKIIQFYNKRLNGNDVTNINFNSSGTGFIKAFSKVDVLDYLTKDSSVVKVKYYINNSEYGRLDNRENISYVLRFCLHDTLPSSHPAPARRK